jgi:broad specificity phosphatase PhoE
MRLQGRRSDPALSTLGKVQARCAARWLAERGLDAVYASPLTRARQTAEEIAGPLGLKVELVDELTEVDVGQWEELSWEEIERRNPEAYRLFSTDASIHPYFGGENLNTVQARAIPTITRLMAANVGRRVAAVTHNGVLRSYMAHLLNLPLPRYRSIPQNNCGVNLVRLKDGRPELITLNAVSHLDAF